MTIHHAGQLIKSMVRLAKEPEKLEFYLYALKNKDWSVIDVLRKEGISNKIETVDVAGAKKRSVGHAQAANLMLERMDSSVVNIVADADAMVVMPNWDNMVSYMISKGVGTMGTPYEDVGGFTSGTGLRQTYKGLPNVIWMLMSPGIPWNTLDMMPDKKNETALDANSACINGLQTGQILFRDVGWRIPSFIYKHQVPYVTFRHIKPSQKAANALRGLDWDYHEEYQLNNIPFCVHHRGASKHPYRKSGKSNAFYDRVWQYIDGVANVCYDWDEVFAGVEPRTIKLGENVVEPVQVAEIERQETEQKVWYPEIKHANNFLVAAAMIFSGEDTVSEILNAVGVPCGHDSFYNTTQAGFTEINTGDASGWAGYYIDGIPEGIPIFHLVRHPCRVINDWVTIDSAVATEDSHIFNTPESHKWVEKFIGDNWMLDETWERAAKLWIRMNTSIENCGKLCERIQFEKLNEEVINRIIRKSKMVPNGDVKRALQRAMSKPPKIRVREKLSKNRLSEKTWTELVYMSHRYGYDDLE